LPVDPDIAGVHIVGMKNVPRFAIPGLMMTMAAPLFAGGLWFQIGNPKAVSDQAGRDAFATVRVFGFGGWILQDPFLTGTAEGIVNHKRVSMPLAFAKLAPEGLCAIRWERPKEGTWVLDLRLHEWSQPGQRVVDRNLSADVFFVGDDGSSLRSNCSFRAGMGCHPQRSTESFARWRESRSHRADISNALNTWKEKCSIHGWRFISRLW
jgi:hypothetical protein